MKKRKIIAGVAIALVCIAVVAVIVVVNVRKQIDEQQDEKATRLYELSGYEDIFAEPILQVKAWSPIDSIESVVFFDEDLIEEVNEFLSEIHIEKFTGTLPLMVGGGYALNLTYESGNVGIGFYIYEDLDIIIISVDNVDYLCDKDIAEIWEDMYKTAGERNGYIQYTWD